MKRLLIVFVAVMLAGAGQTAFAVGKQAQIMQDATHVLNAFVEIPENSIPPTLLRQAYGIAVIPSVIKAGFVLGGRYGKGVLSVRTPSGSWSHPVFVSLAGASLGWQIGASSTDIILVFKSQRSIDRIVNGEITLGADASIAAGPVGRSASAATNLKLNAEIYSYSRSRGLFAGIALQGGVISIDEKDSWRYYGGRAGAASILHQSDIKALPQSGQRLVYTLNQYMPAVNGSSGPAPYDAGEGRQQSKAGEQRRNDDQQARSQAAGQAQQQGAQPYGDAQVQPYRGDQAQPYAGGQIQPYDMDGAGQNAAPPRNSGANNGGQSGGGNYGPVYEQ